MTFRNPRSRRLRKFWILPPRVRRNERSGKCYRQSIAAPGRGSGGEATGCFMGWAISHPLLAAFKNTQPITYDYYKTNAGKNMTPTPLKTPHMSLKNLAQPSVPVVTLLLILSLPSCSSMHHRREATVHVLERQNDLLIKLREERKAGLLMKKIQADPLLLRAESHLTQAIQALQDSNRAVKAAL